MKYILDYFAEVGLFLKHDLSVWAETTLRQLIKLRCDSPDIGPTHEETIYLQRYLEHALRNQNKRAEANDIKGRLATIGTSRFCIDLFHFLFTIDTNQYPTLNDHRIIPKGREGRSDKESMGFSLY